MTNKKEDINSSQEEVKVDNAETETSAEGEKLSPREKSLKNFDSLVEAKLNLKRLEMSRLSLIEEYRKILLNLKALEVEPTSKAGQEVTDAFLNELAAISKEIGEVREDNGFMVDRVKTLEDRSRRVEQIKHINEIEFSGTKPGEEYAPLLEKYKTISDKLHDGSYKSISETEELNKQKNDLNNKLDELEKTKEGQVYAAKRDRTYELDRQIEMKLALVKGGYDENEAKRNAA